MKRRVWVLSLLLTLILAQSCEPQGSQKISGPPPEEISGEAELGSLFPGGEAQVGAPAGGAEEGDLSVAPPPPADLGSILPGAQRRETPDLIASGVSKHFDFELNQASVPVVVYQQMSYLNYATLQDNHWEKEFITSPKIISSDPSDKIIPPSLFPSMAIRSGEVRVAYVRAHKIYLTSRGGSGWSRATNEGLPALTNDNHFHLAFDWLSLRFYLAARNESSSLVYANVNNPSSSSFESVEAAGGGSGSLFLTSGPRKALYLFELGNTFLRFYMLLPEGVARDWINVEDIPNGPSAVVATNSAFHVAYESTGRLLHYLRFDDRGNTNAGGMPLLTNGTNPSIAIHGEQIFITYYRNQALWLAKRTASGWPIRKIAGGPGENVGEKSIVKVDPQGKIHIVYYDTLNRSLRYFSDATP